MDGERLSLEELNSLSFSSCLLTIRVNKIIGDIY